MPDAWPQNQIPSGTTVFTFDGYLVYPNDVIPSSVDHIQADPVLYFNYGCAVSNPWVPILDLSAAVSGQIAAESSGQAASSSATTSTLCGTQTSSPIMPDKIKVDLIGHKIPAGDTGTWTFDQISEFKDLSISSAEQHAGITTFHATLEVEDFKTHRRFAGAVDIDYHSNCHFSQVAGRFHEVTN